MAVTVGIEEKAVRGKEGRELKLGLLKVFRMMLAPERERRAVGQKPAYPVE